MLADIGEGRDDTKHVKSRVLLMHSQGLRFVLKTNFYRASHGMFDKRATCMSAALQHA